MVFSLAPHLPSEVYTTEASFELNRKEAKEKFIIVDDISSMTGVTQKLLEITSTLSTKKSTPDSYETYAVIETRGESQDGKTRKPGELDR